jgi:hypothetical protein
MYQQLQLVAAVAIGLRHHGQKTWQHRSSTSFGGFGNDVFVDGHFTIKRFFFKAANSLISLGITLINDG